MTNSHSPPPVFLRRRCRQQLYANQMRTAKTAIFVQLTGQSFQNNPHLHIVAMIVECIKTFQRVKRKKVKELLWEKLPDILTDKQKEAKITTLLTSLRKKESVQTP